MVQYSGKMPVWAKVELLYINFDGLKVQFDEWPISLSKFQARLIDKAMEQFEESSCIFVRELYGFKNEPSWKIAGWLHFRCRLFMRLGPGDPMEVRGLRAVQWDAAIFLSLC